MSFLFEPGGAPPVAGPTPDARVWRLVTVPNSPGRFPAAGTYLTGTAVPRLPDGGVTICPHTSFRATAEGASGHTGMVRDMLADGLAERGYRVDPAADLTVHFKGDKVTKSRVPAKEVLNPKWDQRPPPGFVLLAPVDMYEVSFQMSIRDRQGRLLWQSQNRGAQVLDFEGKGRMLGWTQAAKQAASGLPAGLVRLVPDAPPINLPLKASARADGTAD